MSRRHMAIDEPIERGEVKTDPFFPAVHDDRRVTADPVPDGGEESSDRGGIEDVDTNTPTVSIQQSVDPIGHGLKLARKVFGQGLSRLTAPQPFTDPNLPKRQLAVLAVIEDRRRVGDDLD
jgi:hypothetical protein